MRRPGFRHSERFVNVCVCFIFGAQSYGYRWIFYAWLGGFFCGLVMISVIKPSQILNNVILRRFCLMERETPCIMEAVSMFHLFRPGPRDLFQLLHIPLKSLINQLYAKQINFNIPPTFSSML